MDGRKMIPTKIKTELHLSPERKFCNRSFQVVQGCQNAFDKFPFLDGGKIYKNSGNQKLAYK